MVKEDIVVRRFAAQMLIELDHNKHKGSVLDWTNFDNMITELEYHKAKMFMAIRSNNPGALKEYIADTANILLAVGNKFGLYAEDTVDTDRCFELNKENLIIEMPVKEGSKNQKLV